MELSEASLQDLVDEIRDRMSVMDMDDRWILMSKLLDGFCLFCGDQKCEVCQCMNDE